MAAEDLAGAPCFGNVYPSVSKILQGRTLVSWYADFDRNVLVHACERAGYPELNAQWECALERYQEWRGFRCSLAEACQIEGILAHGLHSALGDARLVYGILVRMAHLVL